MKIQVIFEDNHILVVNKPPFLVVNRADSVKEKTIQDWVDESFDYELAHDDQNRNGIVHRLDKDTSGVMLLAKTLDAMKELQRQFHDRETKKTYQALVHGVFSAKEGTISLPMGRSKFDRQKFTVEVGGKMTETHYKVVKEFEKISDKKLMVKGYQGFSLVELHPKTGRTHQIRVVLTHLHHPIVGDGKYVGRKRSKADVRWCPRQFLHALKLEFSHPDTGDRVEHEAPLSDDLSSSLALLV
ncbi:RluA family pseudouridine synthase [Patescibacteria group bacterium]